mmetsp:Transcript_24206/g.60595  ORF Transcript_24206/g.60595 Transcript_24206/m.60595 type:complete len:367 (+) Transcript_24206:740-1840(+)
MATCLSQLYHEHSQGIKSGYAKYELFPIWNLPVDHPINVAYEAATADLDDKVIVDSFHPTPATNYNRDVEAFPLLRRILCKIVGEEKAYHSPTEMGMNHAGFAITDEAVCIQASKEETIRRYYLYITEAASGITAASVVQVARGIVDKIGATIEKDRSLCVPLDQLKPTPALGSTLHDGTTVLVVDCESDAALAAHNRLRVPATVGVAECEGSSLKEVGGLRFATEDGRITYLLRTRPLLSLTASLLYYLLVPHEQWGDDTLDRALQQRQQVDLVLGGNNISARYPWSGCEHGHAPHLRAVPLCARDLLQAIAALSTCCELARSAIATLPELYATQMHGNHIASADDGLLIRQLGMHCTFDNLKDK